MTNAQQIAPAAHRFARLRVVRPEPRPTGAPQEPTPKSVETAPSALALPNRGLFVVTSTPADRAGHALTRAFAEPLPPVPANIVQGAQTLAAARRIVAQIESEIEARATRDRLRVRARLQALEAAHGETHPRPTSRLRSAWQRFLRRVAR